MTVKPTLIESMDAADEDTIRGALDAGTAHFIVNQTIDKQFKAFLKGLHAGVTYEAGSMEKHHNNYAIYAVVGKQSLKR